MIRTPTDCADADSACLDCQYTSPLSRFCLAPLLLKHFGMNATIRWASVVVLAACAAPSSETVTNVWSGARVDQTKLPLGDGLRSTTGPAVGRLFECARPPPRPGMPPPPGADVAGPWIDLAAQTWDKTKKVFVSGAVMWPAAEYGESVSGTTRTLVTNGLPVKTVTGTFPIAPSEPAYAYDRNPNSIKSVLLRYELPVTPNQTSASCLPEGPIGLLRNGVAMFSPVDARGRDAVAWETQDSCEGHPEIRGEYHYHDVSGCLVAASAGPSTVIGWAADGFPIVVERDASGALPTNTDLDECHGRDAPYLLDGKVVRGYHYAATLEYPYAVGCFRGAPLAAK
jgi:hypothetical protein